MSLRNLETKDPNFKKITTKDAEIEEIKYRTEKHDYESFLKSLRIDIGYYEIKYKGLNKKEVLLIFTEILMGAASTISSSTFAILNPTAGFIISTALLTSSAILVTNDYISKLKIRYTNLRDWINVITSVYEKTLKTSMVDKTTDGEEALE